MNLLKRLWSKLSYMTTLTKLIISLFLIVIPLYAFNYYINEMGAEKNREEISNQLISSVRSHHSILETELIGFKQSLEQLSVDIALSQVEIIGPDVPYNEKWEYILFLNQHLKKIQYSSLLVESAFVYLPSLEMKVGLEGIVTEYDQDEYEALSKHSELFTYWNDGLYVNVPYVFRNNNQEGLFVIAVKVMDKQMENFLSNIMSYDQGGAMMFHLHESWNLTSRGDDPKTVQTISQYLREVNEKQPYQNEVRIDSIRIQDVPYLVVYDRSRGMNTMLAAYAPEDEVFSSLSVYREFFWIMSFLSIFLIILFSLWMYRVIHKPLKTLVGAFRKVESGSLQFTLEHSNKDEFGYLYRRFNEMVSSLNMLIHTVYEQRYLNQRTELKRLQSQINPHFLYNNFFVLQRLISMNQNEQAAQFTKYLSQYFQFVTRDAADEIPLKNEVEHALVYIEIQSICLDNRVKVIFEPLPKNLESILVPRLILQPILENSYKYVFENMVSDGKLVVRFIEDEDRMMITIEDNGTELSDAALRDMSEKLINHQPDSDETTGLINVHRRIQLKFGEQSGITYARSSHGGLKTTITLQRHKGGD